MTDKPDLPWDDSIAPMWRKIYCGEGWWPIIADLDQELRLIAPDYRVLQVKEKFAGLRYYTTAPPQDVKDVFFTLIRDAEQRADRICEECGRQGAIQSGHRGWIRTLCEEHHAARRGEN